VALRQQAAANQCMDVGTVGQRLGCIGKINKSQVRRLRECRNAFPHQGFRPVLGGLHGTLERSSREALLVG
jgi:hypothetical protein